MAVTATLANNFKALLGSGGVDFTTDAFRVILMNDTFTFDPDTHEAYSNVSADELATNYGYTQGAKELVVDAAWAKDNVNDKAAITWTDVSWAASGGSIGPSAAAVILMHDAGTPANSVVVGAIDFGQALTATTDSPFPLTDLGMDLV